MVTEHNVQPVLVESEISKRAEMEYVILFICDACEGFRLPAGSWTLFKECLPGHSTVVDPDVHLNSGSQSMYRL